MTARRRPGSRIAAAVLGVVLLGSAGVLSGPARPARAATDDTVRADRVLIVAVPGLGWADVRSATTPNLLRIRQNAGMALLSTRIGQQRASVGDVYLTMGAGTRAVSADHDAAYAFERRERFERREPAVVYEERTGRSSNAKILHQSIAEILEVNEASNFDATPGALGDALEAAGVARAVIANADRGEVAPEDVAGRWAAAALMNGAGELTLGRVDASLSTGDPAAPFGRRADADAFTEEFANVWDGARRRVVLVETADLLRLARAESLTAPDEYASMRADTLRSVDALIGRLLAAADSRRDAIMVVGFPAATDEPALGMFALQAPGLDPGLLQSGLTRRAGYVAMADVAPTVLELLAVETEVAMEGRPMFVGDGGGSAATRQRELERALDETEFRQEALTPFFVVLGLACAAVLAGLLLSKRRGRAVPVAVRTVAEGLLAVIAAAAPAGLVDGARRDAGVFVPVLASVAVTLWLLARAAQRRRPGGALAVLLGSVVVVLAADLVTGGRLQLNTMFGYSAEVGGRFAGIGNLGFALLAPAALILAVEIATESRWRQGRLIASAILVGAVLVGGLPYLGADVGGVVAMVPAFAAVVAVLTHRRIRGLDVVGVVAATGSLVLLFGFLDLARPEHDRAHLARLAEQIRDDGPGGLVTTVVRRWQGSFGGPVTSVLALAVAIGGAVGAVVFARRLVRRAIENRTGADRVAPSWFPDSEGARALLVGLGVLGVVGLFVNDSSVAVPGVMLLVVIPAVALRAAGSPTAEIR